jgi:predicted acylesterase/phospholipase RssA
MSKTAVVISGGSARGAYAAGLLGTYFRCYPQHANKIDIVSGTSTGSLVAPMLALGLSETKYLDKMVDGYRVASSDLFFTKPKTITWRVVNWLLAKVMDTQTASMLSMLGETGATLDTTPFKSFVWKHFDDEALTKLFAGNVECVVNCVSAQTGKVVSISSKQEGMDPETYRNAIYSSCLQPLIMPLNTFSEIGHPPQDYMDGGVREVVPVYSAWEVGATKVLVISLFRDKDQDQFQPGPFAGPKNVIQLLLRVVVGLLNGEVEQDDVLQARYLATIGRLTSLCQDNNISTNRELDLLLPEEQARFKTSSVFNRLYVHRPQDSSILVDGLEWTKEEMDSSISCGQHIALGKEGRRIYDFLDT